MFGCLERKAFQVVKIGDFEVLIFENIISIEFATRQVCSVCQSEKKDEKTENEAMCSVCQLPKMAKPYKSKRVNNHVLVLRKTLLIARARRRARSKCGAQLVSPPRRYDYEAARSVAAREVHCQPQNACTSSGHRLANKQALLCAGSKPVRGNEQPPLQHGCLLYFSQEFCSPTRQDARKAYKTSSATPMDSFAQGGAKLRLNINDARS